MIKTESRIIETQGKESLIDITKLVENVVKKTPVKSGQVTVFIPHTTAAITINENTDPDVQSDILLALNKIVPNDQAFTHFEGNSDAHTKASLMGFSETVLFENNAIILGTWQALYLCEFDGPKKRTVVIQVNGD